MIYPLLFEKQNRLFGNIKLIFCYFQEGLFSIWEFKVPIQIICFIPLTQQCICCLKTIQVVNNRGGNY